MLQRKRGIGGGKTETVGIAGWVPVACIKETEGLGGGKTETGGIAGWVPNAQECLLMLIYLHYLNMMQRVFLLFLEQKELLPPFSSFPPLQALKVNCKTRAIINDQHNNSLMVHSLFRFTLYIHYEKYD